MVVGMEETLGALAFFGVFVGGEVGVFVCLLGGLVVVLFVVAPVRGGVCARRGALGSCSSNTFRGYALMMEVESINGVAQTATQTQDIHSVTNINKFTCSHPNVLHTKYHEHTLTHIHTHPNTNTHTHTHSHTHTHTHTHLSFPTKLEDPRLLSGVVERRRGESREPRQTGVGLPKERRPPRIERSRRVIISTAGLWVKYR
jgi:hypothetical protein